LTGYSAHLILFILLYNTINNNLLKLLQKCKYFRKTLFIKTYK
jgi:hypothetical protein